MNTLALITLCALGAILMGIGYQAITGDAKPVGSAPVGARPGDIGKSTDIVRSAKERGHDIAAFAAG